MRKMFLMLVGAMMMCTMNAQELKQGESALVYYSPKTSLKLEFTYTVETQQRGMYADFAEDLLGAAEFVAENSTTCTLNDVHIGTYTSTDYTHPHKVSAEEGIPMLLTINEKGRLIGYNVTPQEDKPASKQDKPCMKPGRKSRIHSIEVAPYTEDVLKAATPEAQAFEAAKQIFHIRETRSYLLNGEVEHVPADGKAMELVLAELDKQEQALTDLFVGTKSIKREKKEIRLEPSNENYKLFFSEENGFTNGDNIDADSIVVYMNCKQQTVQPADDSKKKKKGTELSQIVYTIPGTCDVNVVYKGHSMAQREIAVPQLGVDVALPKAWFMGAELPKIVFSEKTGNIISISK